MRDLHLQFTKPHTITPNSNNPRSLGHSRFSEGSPADCVWLWGRHIVREGGSHACVYKARMKVILTHTHTHPIPRRMITRPPSGSAPTPPPPPLVLLRHWITQAEFLPFFLTHAINHNKLGCNHSLSRTHLLPFTARIIAFRVYFSRKKRSNHFTRESV